MRLAHSLTALVCLCGSALAGGITDPRLQLSDLTYQGAFRLPFQPYSARTWKSSFSYGGYGLAYNPTGGSLFIGGNINDQLVAEISIPTPVNSSNISDLPVAKMLQPFADVTGGLRLQLQTDLNAANEGGARIGGLLVEGNRLVWSVYIYYDALGKARVSHGYSTLNLSQPEAQGIYALQGISAGAVAGYMGSVPLDWRLRFGVPVLTGQAGIPIVWRTSAGPSAVGFDPLTLGSSPAPTTVFLDYPLRNPLGPPLETSQVWNSAAKTAGLAFISRGGKSSVMILGSRGQGVFWYGSWRYQGLVDLGNPYHGCHAPPYAPAAWLYDPNDLLAVKNGKMSPWEVRPYNIVNLPNMYPSNFGRLGGAAYDAINGLLYVSQLEVDNTASRFASGPVIHVFKVADGTAAGGGTTPTTPIPTPGAPVPIPGGTLPKVPVPSATPPKVLPGS